LISLRLTSCYLLRVFILEETSETVKEDFGVRIVIYLHILFNLNMLCELTSCYPQISTGYTQDACLRNTFII
jgi:hypothetical protein